MKTSHAAAMTLSLPPIIDCHGAELLDWLPEERAAWAMAEVIPTADWVERHVRIPEKGAALPGPVDLGLTPYLRGPFEAVDDPAIEVITFMSGSQLGKTLFLYGAMLSGAAQRPGPRLLVMPVEADAREVAGGPLKDMARECDPIMDLTVAGEASLMKEGYELVSGNVHFGWSNSAASLARRACREVYYDEVDKYPPYIGKDVDAISLGDKRLRTFRNTTGSKSIRVSTPTTPDGLIAQSYDESDKRTFRVPCPSCGAYQRLVWRDGVLWPKGEDGRSLPAERIEREDLARYACAHCKATWTDAEKNAAVRLGVWARAGETAGPGGRVTGDPERPGRHAGFHISAIYSPFTTLSQLAAAFLTAEAKGPIALQDFVNNELGEIWLERETETDESRMRKHAGGYDKATIDPETGLVTGVMPAGVQAITAFVDVQRLGFYVAVEGWGFGLESWVLDYRQIATDADLGRYLRTARFRRAGHESQVGGIRLTLMDSGDQAAKVYALLDAWRDIDIRGVRGASSDGGPPWAASFREKDPRTGRAYKAAVPHYTRHPQLWKDVVAMRMQHDEPGPGYFHLPADVDGEFLRQLCSEHKAIDRRRGKAGRSSRTPRKAWVLKPGHAANHYWDCAVGNEFAAELLGLRFLPDPNAKRPKAKKKKPAGDAWKPSRWDGHV